MTKYHMIINCQYSSS